MATDLRRALGSRLGAAMLCVVTAACSPMVHVTVERESAVAPAPEDEVNIALGVRDNGIALSITNVGASPVEVLWQKAVVVDTAGRASGVIHGDHTGAWAVPDLPAGEDISRIPPGSTLYDMLLPTDRVVFDKYYGWLVQPFLPVECGPIRCTGYHELVGQVVRLSLPMQVQ